MSYCGFRILHIAENSQCWKTVILLVNFRWWALCRHLNSPSSWQWWSLNMPRKATSNLSTFYCTIGWADFLLSIVRKLVIIYCVKIKQSFNYSSLLMQCRIRIRIRSILTRNWLKIRSSNTVVETNWPQWSNVTISATRNRFDKTWQNLSNLQNNCRYYMEAY